jgi:hypothetical protein
MTGNATIIVDIIRHQCPHDILHPGRQSWQTHSEIGGDGMSLIFVGENCAQPPQDAPSIIRIGKSVSPK